MKKNILFTIIIIVVSALVLTACGDNDQSASIPDPCLLENMDDTLSPVHDLMREFDDTTYVATITNQANLTEPILLLQDVRRRAERLDIPACAVTLQQAAVNYMNSVIGYLGLFMAGAEHDQISATINDSQTLRLTYENENARLLGTTYTPPQVENTPETAAATEAPADTATVEVGITVTNSGTGPVNMRSGPSVDDLVVATLPAGASAAAVGRTAANDWILITYEGTQGWVSASFVQASSPIENLPESDTTTP
jgi:hypothetical protein